MKRYGVAMLPMLLCSASAFALTPSPAPIEHQAKAVVIYAPAPDYPVEAREAHLTGSGMVLLQIDRKSGYVTAARLLKSTGHAILDNAALRAFRLWRFKPGSAPQIRVPIHYTIGGKT
jgi:TonB family protein